MGVGVRGVCGICMVSAWSMFKCKFKLEENVKHKIELESFDNWSWAQKRSSQQEIYEVKKMNFSNPRSTLVCWSLIFKGDWPQIRQTKFRKNPNVIGECVVCVFVVSVCGLFGVCVVSVCGLCVVCVNLHWNSNKMSK